MLALLGVITYKVMSKHAFWTKIESHKKEKDEVYSQGTQRNIFARKNQRLSPIIQWLEIKHSSVKNEIVMISLDKVEGKEQLIFITQKRGLIFNWGW